MITMPILAKAFEIELMMVTGGNMGFSNPFTAGFDVQYYIEKYKNQMNEENICVGSKTNRRINKK